MHRAYDVWGYDSKAISKLLGKNLLEHRISWQTKHDAPADGHLLYP